MAADGGDVALAAKALAQFRRETELLEFKGGVMGGEAITAEQIAALSRLPARDVLHGQLVAMVASPITGLVRGLNALIAGLAIQLQQIADAGPGRRRGRARARPRPRKTRPGGRAPAESGRRRPRPRPHRDRETDAPSEGDERR